MRLSLALAALVAVASALPSALTTREDFVEDDFEIQAEPDDNTKRSVGWPEVSIQGVEDFFLFFCVGWLQNPSIRPLTQTPSSHQRPRNLSARYVCKWPLTVLTRSPTRGTG